MSATITHPAAPLTAIAAEDLLAGQVVVMRDGSQLEVARIEHHRSPRQYDVWAFHASGERWLFDASEHVLIRGTHPDAQPVPVEHAFADLCPAGGLDQGPTAEEWADADADWAYISQAQRTDVESYGPNPR